MGVKSTKRASLMGSGTIAAFNSAFHVDFAREEGRMRCAGKTLATTTPMS